MLVGSSLAMGFGYKLNSSNTLVYSPSPKGPIDSFGVNLLQWCENRSRRILYFFQLGRECVLLFFLYYFSLLQLRNLYTR